LRQVPLEPLFAGWDRQRRVDFVRRRALLSFVRALAPHCSLCSSIYPRIRVRGLLERLSQCDHRREICSGLSNVRLLCRPSLGFAVTEGRVPPSHRERHCAPNPGREVECGPSSTKRDRRWRARVTQRRAVLLEIGAREASAGPAARRARVTQRRAVLFEAGACEPSAGLAARARARRNGEWRACEGNATELGCYASR